MLIYTMSICYLLLLSTDVPDMFVRFCCVVADLPKSESALVDLVGTVGGFGEIDGCAFGWGMPGSDVVFVVDDGCMLKETCFFCFLMAAATLMT